MTSRAAPKRPTVSNDVAKWMNQHYSILVVDNKFIARDKHTMDVVHETARYGEMLMEMRSRRAMAMAQQMRAS